MTDQELFDLSATHLLQQGRRSIRHRRGPLGSGCAYRGDDGTKCAIGCAIPDDQYDPLYEGTGARALIEGRVRAINGERMPRLTALDGCTPALIEDLQLTHDAYASADWAIRLADVAQTWDLTMPPALLAALPQSEAPTA